jgi:hypothetical protein
MRLTPETPASWGIHKAQGMIEHLVEAVEYTNGKRIAVLHLSADEADKSKQLLVRSDFVINKGAKGHLSDATKTKRYRDLPAAIDQLKQEIDAFEFYFATPGRAAIHQAFGPMNREDWITWQTFYSSFQTVWADRFGIA